MLSCWMEIDHSYHSMDRSGDTETYCMKNPKAKELYDQNECGIWKKVMNILEKYSYPRSNQSIISYLDQR